jgi:hypothetical protein
MLHRAFTSSAIVASLIMASGGSASAGVLGSTLSQAQHDWVGANAGAAVVSSVYPSYGFSASERPSFDAGGAGSTTPAASSAPVVMSQAPQAGTIALSARHQDGAEAIDVTGTAPPGTSVEITARAKISIDLPVVFLNRLTAVADSSGAFSVILPIAPDFIPGTEITIQAQAPDANPATVSFIVGAPTSGPPITSTDVDNDRGP